MASKKSRDSASKVSKPPASAPKPAPAPKPATATKPAPKPKLSRPSQPSRTSQTSQTSEDDGPSSKAERNKRKKAAQKAKKNAEKATENFINETIELNQRIRAEEDAKKKKKAEVDRAKKVEEEKQREAALEEHAKDNPDPVVLMLKAKLSDSDADPMECGRELVDNLLTARDLLIGSGDPTVIDGLTEMLNDVGRHQHVDCGVEVVRVKFAGLEASQHTEDPDSDEESSSILADDMFSIALNPETGKGLFVKEDVEAGTLLLIEQPFFYAKSTGLWTPALITVLGSKLYEMAENLHQICPCDGVCVCETLVEMAIAASGLGGKRFNCLYEYASHINHSCQPNSKHSIDVDTGLIYIVTNKDLEAHDQITIAYGFSDNASARKRWLKSQAGLDCTCIACQSNAKLGEEDKMMGFLDIEEIQLNEAVVYHKPKLNKQEHQRIDLAAVWAILIGVQCNQYAAAIEESWVKLARRAQIPAGKSVSGKELEVILQQNFPSDVQGIDMIFERGSQYLLERNALSIGEKMIRKYWKKFFDQAMSKSLCAAARDLMERK